MSMFKDKINFDRMHANGVSPWEVWEMHGVDVLINGFLVGVAALSLEKQ